MKTHWNVIQVLSITTLFALGCEQSAETDTQVASVQPAETILAEAACGQCQFGLPGGGCDLAVRIDGTAYYVDGSSIDDHGDAHGATGVCNAIRQARVEGRVEKGRFVATSVEVIPVDSE